jgi:hypothetical protein
MQPKRKRQPSSNHAVSRNFVEFDSMINIRPAQGNRSRGVDDPKAKKTIRRALLWIVWATRQNCGKFIMETLEDPTKGAPL